MPENRRAYNIQQFANFRVAHIQEVGQKDNVAFPFGQSVKAVSYTHLTLPTILRV